LVNNSMKFKDRGGDGKFEKKRIPWNKSKRINLNLDILKKRYFDEKKSTYEIAKEFNVNQKTIENRLKENGFILRKRGQHTERTKQKIRQTNIRKGIQPKERYSGKPTSGCFKKGNNTWNKGLIGVQESTKKGKTYKELYGEEKSKQYIKLIKERRAKQVLPVKDTTIEVIIQDFLKKLGIEFFTHQYMKIKHGYQCDILVPKQERVLKKTIIEVFGDYWHNYPYAREIDIKRCNELREKGYRVLVFWEREIRQMPINVIGGKLAR